MSSMENWTIHNARDWRAERLAPYQAHLAAAIEQVCARFPDEISPQMLMENIISGRTDLWLILDEGGRFAAFLTTEMEVTARGRKRFLLLELAGRGGAGLARFLPELEAYARAHGAAEICPYGRLGWSRELAKHGYKIANIKYAKEL